jgi:hypothetical protein
MSIGLEVKLTKPIIITSLLPKTGEALHELLGLSFIPEIVAEEYVDHTWKPLQSDLLSEDARLIGISITGEPETASLFAHSRRGDDRPKEERGVFAIIEVTGARTPLALALTAAVAVALGRECATDVTDNMPFFSSSFDQSADDFVKAIKVKEGFGDYRSAAKTFYRSLGHGSAP